MPDNSTWYERAAKAFGDTINQGVNAATGGFLNKGIGAVMGATPEQVAAYNQGTAAETGVAGGVARGLGTIYGGSKLIGAAGAGLGMARAAPAAVSLVPTAGLGTAARFLVGKAGPGLIPAVESVAPKASTILKAAAGLGIVGGSVADGLSGAVTPTAGVGPQGKYTPAQLAERDAYMANPVASALATGRAATAAVTPYQKQLDVLSTILGSKNATLSDVQAASAMLPKPPRVMTNKDVEFGKSAALSRAIFESQISSIAAQKDAGDLTAEKAQEMTSKAMAAEFQRQSGMQGLNPLNMAQAGLMTPDPEDN